MAIAGGVASKDFFCTIKAFRRVATGHDKADQSYRAMIHLAATGLARR
jgi:transposase